jgi:hypothetical protein
MEMQEDDEQLRDVLRYRKWTQRWGSSARRRLRHRAALSRLLQRMTGGRTRRGGRSRLSVLRSRALRGGGAPAPFEAVNRRTTPARISVPQWQLAPRPLHPRLPLLAREPERFCGLMPDPRSSSSRTAPLRTYRRNQPRARPDPAKRTGYGRRSFSCEADAAARARRELLARRSCPWSCKPEGPMSAGLRRIEPPRSANRLVVVFAGATTANDGEVDREIKGSGFHSG